MTTITTTTMTNAPIMQFKEDATELDTTDDNASTSDHTHTTTPPIVVDDLLKTTERTYVLPVDHTQDDKATCVKLNCFARPHMRAFHCAWWGYFIAFNLWFAAAPLLSEIRDSLGLDDQQIWTSSIAGVGGTIVMRFLLGPLCDKYGARILYLLVLCGASIPTACLGFVNTATGLTVCRLFVGFAGGTFVMCQYWCSNMFTKEVVGTANATAAGWGNLGAGVGSLLMGSALFPLFKWFYGHNPDLTEDQIAEDAWRTVSVVPASIAFCSGIIMYFISEDAPKGNFKQLKRDGHMEDVHLGRSFLSGLLNVNTWLLFIQYACCFGVEMTMNNAAALYFKDQFGQSTESAAAIASIFGFLNLFARGLGGFCSDKANAKAGMRGRLWVQTIVLVLEGSLILVFSQTESLASAIVVMASFSLFVQMAEGSSYGIVPYVNPPITGSISGIVGAGGNVGAVAFSFGFRQLRYEQAFQLMGLCIIGSAFLSIFIFVRHHPGMIFAARYQEEDDPQAMMMEVDGENALALKPSSDLALTDGSDVDSQEEGQPYDVEASLSAHHRTTHEHATTGMGEFAIELSSESQMQEHEDDDDTKNSHAATASTSLEHSQ